MPLTEVTNYNSNAQTQLNAETFQIKTLTKSTTVDFLKDLYSYPSKFSVKWDATDELKQDLFLNHNYGVLEHSIPFIDFVEDWFFNDFSTENTITEKYSKSAYIDGFLDKVNTSNFYTKKTKDIQTALATIPVYVVLDGNKEIILNKTTTLPASNNISSYLIKNLYNYCGEFDKNVSSRQDLGFFFLNSKDAEIYLQEIAKSDIVGTQTLGLSINCISLDSAYRITREHHPGIDFRFVPNFNEVKNLLQNEIGTSDAIIEDEQQQLRFRRRTVNMFPYLGKLGNFISISSSFLQRNEYFKGVPIYIVQVSDSPKNLITESYYTTIGIIDTAYSRCIQFLDYTIGFGHNWIMQGSIKEPNNSKNVTNYVFFEKKEAKNFVKSQGKEIIRYKGSRTSNLEFIIRKPKIFIYNLEDFIEFWENTIQTNLNITNLDNNNIFDAKTTYFIPPQVINEDIFLDQKEYKQTFLKNVGQALNVKVRVFKQFIGVFFSVN